MSTKICKCMDRIKALVEEIGEEEVCKILIKAKAEMKRLKVEQEK